MVRRRFGIWELWFGGLPKCRCTIVQMMVKLEEPHIAARFGLEYFLRAIHEILAVFGENRGIGFNFATSHGHHPVSFLQYKHRVGSRDTAL